MPALRVLRTSGRLPADQLTWPAWQALHAGPVRVGSADHPLLRALTAAGIAWEVSSLDDAADGVWLAAADDALPEGAEVLVGSQDPPGARLLDVVAVMDRLRSPGGCPWDAEQTHTSLMPYLLEEAYETYEALENGDLEHLREELGDLLLQVVFHARIAEDFDVDTVAEGLVDKLVRRHPHVFAGASADDLEGNWERIKAQEKGRTSVVEGVPLGQPALSLAAKLQRRATRAGLSVPSYDGLGGELWELVRRCAEAGLDPEVELRTVARAFRDEVAG